MAPTCLLAFLEAMLNGLLAGICVGVFFAAWLSLARLTMLAYYWPGVGFDTYWSELSTALVMGLRFDLKVSASAGLLMFPFAGWSFKWTRRLFLVCGTSFALVAVVNFYYYGFYKLPIDAVIFGLFDDDTAGVIRTIWLDFPIVQIFLVLAIAVYTVNVFAMRMGLDAYRYLQSNLTNSKYLFLAPLLLVLLAFVAKGTLKGSPLDLDNTTATSKPFLNSVVPNGVTALYNAWNTYSHSADVGDDDHGLKSLGFKNIQEVASVLGFTGGTPEEIKHALISSGANALNGNNLVFVQMESWSAEPFRYQSKDMDVLAGLAHQLPKAWVFDNFDSVQNGTHPALEAILFSTPVTPITSGKYRGISLDWSVARVMKNSGYDTLFVTSGPSAWRELNHVLVTQGFDEVIDAAALRVQFPEAEGGVWGVWDSYMFRAIEARLARQPKNRPLFVYAMPTTNHPPYELPTEYVPFPFETQKWPGDKSSDSLILNLQTYRYANDELAKFVASIQNSKEGASTIIAATGDHNARSFGQYDKPESRILRYQVPFVVWGAGKHECPNVMHQVASHLDIFPTLFPMLGIYKGFLKTGRDLTKCPTPKEIDDALSITFLGQVRSNNAIWQLGAAQTIACQPLGSVCEWQPRLDAKARARVALLDWNIRHHIQHATGRK